MQEGDKLVIIGNGAEGSDTEVFHYYNIADVVECRNPHPYSYETNGVQVVDVQKGNLSQAVEPRHLKQHKE